MLSKFICIYRALLRVEIGRKKNTELFKRFPIYGINIAPPPPPPIHTQVFSLCYDVLLSINAKARAD